jgi:hypothetical protein
MQAVIADLAEHSGRALAHAPELQVGDPNATEFHHRAYVDGLRCR